MNNYITYEPTYMHIIFMDNNKIKTHHFTARSRLIIEWNVTAYFSITSAFKSVILTEIRMQQFILVLY